MNFPQQQLDSRIALAATLRAGAASWADVAAKVGRSEDRVRRWPQKYRDAWARHFRTAESHFLAEVAVEARQVLRLLLRSKDEKTQLRATFNMLKVRQAERDREFAVLPPHEPIDPEVSSFVNELRNLGDEEIEQMLRQALSTVEQPAPAGPISGEQEEPCQARPVFSEHGQTPMRNLCADGELRPYGQG
jgi:transposase